jgi:hypothetical protein
MNLYWIDINYACFGIETNSDETVVTAPPIAKWMIGKNIEEVKAFVKRKNGKMKVKR